MDSIANSTGSKEYAIARDKWASATSLLNDANQRALVAGRASPKGFFDLADMYSTSQGVEGGLRMLFGDPKGGSIQVAKAGVAYTTKRFIKNMNNTDSIIHRTFRNIDLLNERAKSINVAQKSAKDVFLYLKNLPRGARQQVFVENPEFAKDVRETIRPMISLSYQKGKGVSGTIKSIPYQEPKMLEYKGNILELPEGGIMYKNKPSFTAEIQPGYEQTKAFLQELWQDLSVKVKSESGAARIRKEEPTPTEGKVTAEQAVKQGMSAEEYVASKGEPVFRGEKENGEGVGQGNLGSGTYITPNKGMAQAGDTKTLGQRNNNPINLKAFEQWEGMTGKDSQGHAVFSDLDYGIRAGLRNLKNHQRKNPDQTLTQYLNSFAEENGTEEARFIAKDLKISPDAKLKDISMERVLIPMAKFESKTTLTPKDILRVKMKFKIK